MRIDGIVTVLAIVLHAARKNDNITGGTTFADKLIELVEAFMDPGSAVSRRKVSERIYDDLAEQRISVERAVFELQRLNKEQKGGWLRQKIRWLPKSGA